MVEPIGIKQLAMGAPGDDRRLHRVVVGKVMAWDMGVHALAQVAEILGFEGIGVILAVPHDEDLPPLPRLGDVKAGFVGLGEHGEFGGGAHVVGAGLGVAGMRRAEHIVKAVHAST